MQITEASKPISSYMTTMYYSSHYILRIVAIAYKRSEVKKSTTETFCNWETELRSVSTITTHDYMELLISPSLHPVLLTIQSTVIIFLHTWIYEYKTVFTRHYKNLLLALPYHSRDKNSYRGKLMLFNIKRHLLYKSNCNTFPLLLYNYNLNREMPQFLLKNRLFRRATKVLYYTMKQTNL